MQAQPGPFSGPRPIWLSRAATAGLALAAGLVATTCTDAPTGPGRAGTGYLAVRPVFARAVDLAAFALSVDSVRVIMVRPPSQVVLDTTIFFPPDADSVRAALRVPLLTSVESFDVTLELRGGGQVLFSGTQQVEVRSGAPDPTQPPTAIVVNYVGPGANVTAIAVEPFDSVVTLGDSLRLRVSAFDAQQQPIAQFYVAWSVTTPEPSITAFGVLRAPGTRGQTYVKARTPTDVVDSVRVTFVPLPATVVADSGSGQSLMVGSATRIVARVLGGDGLPIKGIPVQFSATSGGGQVANSLVATDSGGRAGTVATLSPAAGPQAFEARVIGVAQPATFSITALAGAAAGIQVVGGDGQTGVVGQPLTQPLQALVTDGNANPVSGARVAWAGLTDTDASLSADTTLTDAAGLTSVTYTLGTSPQPEAIQATLVATGATATFNVTSVAGPPAALIYSSQPTNGTPGQVLAPVTVAVHDQFGNLATASATTITLALGANPGGGSLSGTTAVSASAGLATFNDLSLSAAGFGYTLVASAPGVASATSSSFDIVPVGTGSIWIGGDAAGPTNWSNGNNWSTRAIPAATDTVLVPSAAGNQPVLTANAVAADLTVENGASLETNGFVLTVGGNVSAGTTITGSGLVVMTGTGVSVSGSISNLQLGGAVVAPSGLAVAGGLALTNGSSLTMSGTLTVGTDLTVTGATLTLGGPSSVGGNVDAHINGPQVVLNGQRLAVGGTWSGRPPTMQNAADTVVITGNATFDDAASTGLLTAGVLMLGGDFVQLGAVPDNFAATGTHKTVFNGSGSPQAVSMAAPSPPWSHFQEVEVTNPQGLTLTGDALALGSLVVNSGGVSGASRTFTVGGSVVIGGNVSLAGLTTGGLLTVTGTYSVTNTAFTGSGQTIPAGLPYDNLVVTGPGATYSGTVINGTLTVQGGGASLAVTGGLAVGGDILVSGGGAALTMGGLLTTTSNLTVTGATLTLGGPSSVGGNVDAHINGPQVVLNGQRLAVGGTWSGRPPTMQNAADTVVITGNATFDDAASTGLLTAGVLMLGGDFVQLGAVPDNFAATGTHKTVFNGSGSPQAVSMAAPSPPWSHFASVEIANPIGITLGSSVLAIGPLTVTSGVTPTIAGGGSIATVSGLDVDGLVLDNAPLVSDNGAITRFDNVTFQNMDVTAIQLTINHPGQATAFAFDGLSFLTTPTTGFYISAIDNLADVNVLTINLTNSIPSDGTTFTATGGGAIVSWPGSLPGVQWLSAVSGVWSDPARWSTGVVPAPGDSVVIEVPGTYTVTLDVNATVGWLHLGGATGTQTLEQATDTLTVSNAATIAPNGVYNLSGGVLDGTGTATIDGALHWTGGTIGGSGSLALNAGASVTFAGGLKTLDTRSLQNATTIAWTAGDWFFDGTASVTNLAGATFDMQGDVRMAFNTGGTFANLGTFVKSAGAGIGEVSLVFSNDGTVNVQSGTLAITSQGGSLNHNGQFNGAAGTTLSLANAGSNSQTFGGSVAGFEHLLLTNSMFTFNAAVSVGHVATAGTAADGVFNGPVSSIDSVTLAGTAAIIHLNTGSAVNIGYLALGTNVAGVAGTDPLTITDSLFWHYGGLQSSGSVTLTSTAIARIVGPGVPKSAASSFANNGIVFLSGSPVSFTGGLTNAAGATVDIEDDVSVVGPFVNQGTITKTGGAGVATMSAALQNDGVLDVSSGTIALTGDVTHSASGTVQGSGTLDLSGANVLVFDGDVRPGTSPGILSVAGPYMPGAPSTLHVELGGTTVGSQYDQLAVSGAATLSGTLEVTLLGGYTPSIGDQFTVLTFGTRSGDFATVNLPALGGGLNWQRTFNANDMVLEVTGAATGAQVSWSNTAGGNWSVPTNWAGGVVPGPLDTAQITAAGTYTVILDVSPSIRHFVLGGATGTQTLDVSGTQTLTLAANGVIDPNGVLQVAGGDLIVNGGSALMLSGGQIRIEPSRTLTIGSGDFTQLSYNSGAFHGGGVLALFPGTQLALGATLSLDSTTLFLSDAAVNRTTSERLLIGPDALLTLQATTGVNVNAVVENSGALLVRGPFNFVNDSLINLAGSGLDLDGVAGGTLLGVANGLLNHGTVVLTNSTAGAGVTLQVTGGGLRNEVDGTIGSATGAGGGARTLAAELDNLGVVSIQEALTLDQASAAHVNTGQIDLVTGGLSVVQTGISSSFTNRDSIIVFSGQTLLVTGGIFTNDISPTEGIIAGEGHVDVSATTFSNLGFISPGLSPGLLTWQGGLPFGPNAALTIELGGTTAGSGYDQLDVSGFTVAPNGTLDVRLFGGFTPQAGDQFTVLRYGALTGDFSSVNLPTLSGGLSWQRILGATDMVLEVLAPPAQIVFAGDSAGGVSSGVFTVDTDGRNLKNVTPEGPFGDVYPRWSPDRTRITYSASPGGEPNQLHVASPDGVEIAHLTSANDTSTRRARYSPDGVHLAMECGDGLFSSSQDVCVVPDVTAPIALLNGIADDIVGGKAYVTDGISPNLGGSGAFAWNPLDPDQLAVVRDSIVRGRQASQVWLVSFDGKTAMPLTAAALAVAGGDTLRVLTMDWSPDGSFIAFAAVSQTGLSAIYRVDVSDGRVTQLTFPSFGGDFSPVVSPDAKDIVFGRTSDGFEIRQVPSGGGAEVLMTPLFNFSSGQAGWDWSPDGSEIVHTTDKWAGGGIVIGKMKRGTTATSYISDLVLVGRAALAGEVQDIQPSWRP